MIQKLITDNNIVMQLIYIHGFNSSPLSKKGQMLVSYCHQHHPEITVHCPDVNMSPYDVMSHVSTLISQDSQTALVGSSLGGFFATNLVAQHNIPAVLINPSTRPFDTLTDYVSPDVNRPELPPNHVLHTTEAGWRITRQDFHDLEGLYQTKPKHANKLLVLLKTGDEVIDYRLAQAYYAQPDSGAQSQIIIEHGGDHAMLDFEEKIPMVLQFLFG